MGEFSYQHIAGKYRLGLIVHIELLKHGKAVGHLYDQPDQVMAHAICRDYNLRMDRVEDTMSFRVVEDKLSAEEIVKAIIPIIAQGGEFATDGECLDQVAQLFRDNGINPFANRPDRDHSLGSISQDVVGGSIHYFVVAYDSVTKRWCWDTDCEAVTFQGGSVYVETVEGSGSHMYVNSSYTDKINDIDTECSSKLGSMLQVLNDIG